MSDYDEPVFPTLPEDARLSPWLLGRLHEVKVIDERKQFSDCGEDAIFHGWWISWLSDPGRLFCLQCLGDLWREFRADRTCDRCGSDGRLMTLPVMLHNEGWLVIGLLCSECYSLEVNA